MSAPTPAGDRVAAQARFEARTLLANGEQLLVSVLLPAIALTGLALSSVPDLGPGRRADLAAAGALALAVLSTAFTGQAIATGFDRRSGVLRLLGTSPLGRGGLLLGKVLAVLTVLAVQVLVLGTLGLALGWRPPASGILPGVLSLLLGTAVYVALALLLAGTVRAEAVLALANLGWVLLLALGTLVPTSVLPAPLVGVARALPSGALGDAARAAFVDGLWPWGQWAVLAAWALLAGLAASRWFRWSG
ncbi:ABC transporter permease [Phycicoccus endophyticus]|uniref:ABC transporter permease n=1 Tax=Phycicoccus endophyticus TaxID=1690220 RepID=A0A7G9R4E1_9MICO|nr:ABC transporter permease [Phycicoccus endophyticus]NHI18343.1 ABC transporter permease [Phycicoccus endophyticus]QNN50466.1 ABC transporter permease [Phycicoccus endophyticus]GGL24579.1 ABC transporter [Phycicoccus endophyticus]